MDQFLEADVPDDEVDDWVRTASILHSNSAVLLSTVATLSSVVAGDAVLPGGMPRVLAALTLLGLIRRRRPGQHQLHLARRDVPYRTRDRPAGRLGRRHVGVEVARAVARTRAYGGRGGLLTYLPSQWSRNFTFGMFYAFTLQPYKSPRALPQRVILDHGQYVVLLLIEASLFLHDRSLRFAALRRVGSRKSAAP